ncbi:MAG: DUF2069 domain-containing protein [Gammaproteobacteria bacterium]|nr:DUF2069 domain-containing protein [Gammaproteobacteria bacterium]MDP2139322.1 DUF2069 domain-containing protein [Gammaproteobacteria bacterium]MDP2346879.1 DUF2069 domain-containing protein [Gammaproteobacteria bacterium]
MTLEKSAAPALIEQSRKAVILSYCALLLTFTFNGLWQIVNGEITIVAIIFLWLLKVLPILIFLPGLRQKHLRTHAWLSFVVLLYFIVGVQTAFVEETRVYGIIITLLLSILFCALVIYIRGFRNFYKTSL